MQVGGAPMFVLMWFTPKPVVYETLYGGAEQCGLGRHAARLSTKLQAVTLGKKLVKACDEITYSVYQLEGEGGMRLLGSFPKGVNVEGAKVKFRRRAPKTGGADDGTLLGVGGMGDDIWRELMEQDAMGEIDEAWSRFRKVGCEAARIPAAACMLPILSCALSLSHLCSLALAFPPDAGARAGPRIGHCGRKRRPH